MARRRILYRDLPDTHYRYVTSCTTAVEAVARADQMGGLPIERVNAPAYSYGVVVPRRLPIVASSPEDS